MHKRLMEIQARKAELVKELEGEITQERLAEIETEQRELAAEEEMIRKKLDVSGRLGNKEDHSSGAPTGEEERAAKFTESRALTIASGKIAVPKSTENEVQESLVSGNGMLNLVDVQDCTGMGGNLIPYEIPGMAAGTDTEGTSTTGEFQTDYAEIAPVTVDVYTEVSRETKKLSPVKYMQAVERAALKALKKKINALIVTSDNAESPKFFGINKAKAVKAVKEITAIDATTLRDIILSYGGDDDVEGAAVLLLSKEDLQAFGAVRGTNEKKAVYEITPDEANPNTGIIKDGGLSCRYSLNSALTPLSKASAGADVMYYGKPLAYEVDIFSDYEITVSEEAALKSRMIAVLGEVMVGGNVKVYNGFTKVQKKANA